VTEDNLSAWTSQLIERHYEPKHASPNLLVLTGGEPFRQKASAAFIKTLITESTFDFVQIETNGTLWHHELDWALGKSHALHVIVSPKTPRLNSFLAQSMEYVYYKYVIEAGHIDPNDGLPTSVLGMGKRVARPWENAPSFKSEYNERIFVTPMDAQDSVQNEANIEAAVKVCKKYGYRLNLQVHKLVGLP
jgi:organic radical activating enzyme